jgi:hypothetical protein
MVPWYVCLQEYHYDTISIILYVLSIDFPTLGNDILISLGYVNAHDITNGFCCQFCNVVKVAIHNPI